MKVIYLAYRQWALEVYPTIQKHPCVSESVLCKSLEELKQIDVTTYDIILSCGWSYKLDEYVDKVLTIGVHCAELDRYSYGTPIQNQIIDGITRSKHRIFKLSYSSDSSRSHAGDRLFSHEVDLDYSGNMEDIMEQLTVTCKVLFNRFLSDYPNIEWKQWPAEDIISTPRKPEDSFLSKEDLMKMDTEQMYNFFRCLEDPYPNGAIEDEKGILYIKKVIYKKK